MTKNSYTKTSQNQIRYLEEKLACTNEQIYDLKEKLRAYDEGMAAKDVLQKIFNELQQWVEEAVIKHNRINDDQLKTIECVYKKVEESERAVTSLRFDNNKLTNINEDLKEQLKPLKLNEQRIITVIEKLETSNKNLKNDVCNHENELSEKDCTVDKLAERLESEQEELRRVRQELEESSAAVDRLEDGREKLETDLASAEATLEEYRATECQLQERCRDLETELKCARARLEDAESRAAAAEAELGTEAGARAEELECRARRLRDTEAERDRWQRRVAEERCRADGLAAAVTELQAADDRERAEAKAREQRARRDACERDEELRRRAEQLAATWRQNECAVAGMAALETRVRAAECQLESGRRLAEARNREHDQECGRLEREKVALSGELRRHTAEEEETERRACRLRDEIRQMTTGLPPPPSPSPPSPQTEPQPQSQEAHAQDHDSLRAVISDDSFMSYLKRLYRNILPPTASDRG